MKPKEKALRKALIGACLEMNANGLNQGTSGNLSARCGDAFLVTPSGVPYDSLQPEDIVKMRFDGSTRSTLPPSSEWRFHRDILERRADVDAVVHAHPTYCTTLAIRRMDIPAVHYMIAAAGGSSIRCAPYATYGTQELSDHALAALEGRSACLLANHGMIATGPTLAKAMWLAVEVEALARQYFLTLQIGGPVVLDDAEIDRVVEKFKTYGMKPKTEAA